MAPHSTPTSPSKDITGLTGLGLFMSAIVIAQVACGDGPTHTASDALEPDADATPQEDASDVEGEDAAMTATPPCPRLSDARYARTLNPITSDPVWWPAESLEGCLPLSLDDAPTPDLPSSVVHAEIVAAAEVWSSAAQQCGAPVCFTDAGTRSQSQGLGFNPDGENVNLIAFIADEPTWDRDYPADVIAITLTTFIPATSELQDADIVINDGAFLFEDTATPAPGAVDLRAVVIHELGHLLGFEHNNAPDSVMAPYESATLTPPRRLSLDDVTGLCEAYACYTESR